GVDVQPITMGTKHDRMQYELPAVDRRVGHTPAQPKGQSVHTTIDHSAHAAMGHTMPAVSADEAIDHAAMGHDMWMDHAAMGHDMSDPTMAATMEREMRNKFFIALLLTIPTVLYAPLGIDVFGVRLPTFGLDRNVIMLVLSTPVVFYCGWMFISGAYQS